jgi:hypothetical protein
MMRADSRRNPNSTSQDRVLSGLARSNPVLSLASTDPLSILAKKQQEIAVGLTACQVDDPCFLHDKKLKLILKLQKSAKRCPF